MKTLKVRIRIDCVGKAIFYPELDLQPGDYEAVLVIQPAREKAQRMPLDFPIDDLGVWPEGLSLRREDIY